MTSVVAQDAMTVVYTLQAPNPGFAAGLATQVGYVVGQAMIDQANAKVANPTPVGTGPFVYQSWAPNNHFTGTRNPNYWRPGLPYLDQITLQADPRHHPTRGHAQDRRRRHDRIHRSQHHQPVQGASAATSIVDSYHNIIGEPTMAFIMLNCEVAPTNDLTHPPGAGQGPRPGHHPEDLRRRLRPARQRPLPPGVAVLLEDHLPDLRPRRGQEARGRSTRPSTARRPSSWSPSPTPAMAKLVQIVQQMWQQIGVDVTISQIEQADLIDDFIAGKFQAATSYQFGAIDPDLNYVWWSTTTVAPIGGIAPQLPPQRGPGDRAEHAPGRHTTDQATRVQAYQTVNERLAEDLPYLWLLQYIFSEVADRPGPELRQPHPPQRAGRLRVRRGHLLPDPDLAVELTAG